MFLTQPLEQACQHYTQNGTSPPDQHTYTPTQTTKGNLTFSTTEITHISSLELHKSHHLKKKKKKNQTFFLLPKQQAHDRPFLKGAVWKTSWENSQDIFLCPLG